MEHPGPLPQPASAAPARPRPDPPTGQGGTPTTGCRPDAQMGLPTVTTIPGPGRRRPIAALLAALPARDRVRILARMAALEALTRRPGTLAEPPPPRRCA